MPNRRPFDHLVSNKFKFEIDGVNVGSCSAFEGIDTETDVVIFNNGDDIQVRKRPGRTIYANLVLKRGYINTDELWEWYKAVTEGKIERRSGAIISLADDGSEIMRYNFYEGWPCRWKGMKFDANKNGTLFEEIEIAIEKVERG